MEPIIIVNCIRNRNVLYIDRVLYWNLAIIVLLFIPACNNKQDTTIKNTYLEKYFGLSPESRKYANYEINEQDVIDQILLFNVGILKAGYKPVSNEIFLKKTKDFFHIENSQLVETAGIIKYSDFFIVVADDFDHISLEGNFTENELREQKIEYYKETQFLETEKSDAENIVFVKDKNYIMPVLAPFKFMKQDGSDFNMDIPDYIIHRNKFIFNDSNASLTWLINNDLEFIIQLLKRHGYDKNEKINKAVLDTIYNEYTDKKNMFLLMDLFARKDRYNNLNIRHNLMQYISQTTTTHENSSLILLEDFCKGLLSTQEETQILREPFNEERRLEIAAYIAYYVQKTYDLHWKKNTQNWYETSTLYGILSSEDETARKFLQRTKENNYYELNGFKSMIDSMITCIDEEPSMQF